MLGSVSFCAIRPNSTRLHTIDRHGDKGCWENADGGNRPSYRRQLLDWMRGNFSAQTWTTPHFFSSSQKPGKVFATHLGFVIAILPAFSATSANAIAIL